MTTVSVRSFLAAGLAAAVGSVALGPAPGQSPIPAMAVTSAAIRLSAALTPLVQPVDTSPVAELPASEPQASAIGAGSPGNVIINVYNAVEPWVAWGWELAQWALSFVPGLWWVAPGIDMFYFTVEPMVQSLVYSFAYLIDGEPGLIGPTIRAGIQQSVTNFVYYGIAWFESIVPLPPRPPFPIFPFASVAARTASRIAAATATTTPQEATPEAPDVVTEHATDDATVELAPADEQAVATPTQIKARAGRVPVRAARSHARAVPTDPAPAASTSAPIPTSADPTDPAPAPTALSRKSPTRSAPAADRKTKPTRSTAHAG